MARERREGFGRLSSIDLLPPEADAEIAWCVQQLTARKRTQSDILFELNDRLAAIGVPPISASAFNRYTMRRAHAVRSLTERRELGKIVVETLGPDRGDEITILLIDMLKDAIGNAIEGGPVGSKGVLELSRALQALVSAQKMSDEMARKFQADLKQKVTAAVDKVAEVKGLTSDTVATIKAEILGLAHV